MSQNDLGPFSSSLTANKMDLHTAIEREIQAQQMNLNMLSQRSYVSRGLLYAIFSKTAPKPISIRLLDLIGQALHKPEGWLYELYAIENTSGRVHFKKIRNFLIRCVELERKELITQVLTRIMENLSHLQDVFLLAEALYAEGNYKYSILFYRCVCEHEIKQHAERFILSQYKCFRATLFSSSDMKEKHKAAIRFVPYRQRLPEDLQLDALLQLANLCFRLQLWEEVIQYADEMRSLMRIILAHQQERKRKGLSPVEPLCTERHFVVYYGQSILLKGNALEWIGEYDKALPFTFDYEDLSWWENLDEVGWLEVGKFKRFALANRLNLRILIGEFKYLPDYLDYLNRHPDELLPGLLTIISAANRHGYDVDHVIIQYKEQIQNTSLNFNHSYYNKEFQFDRYAKLSFNLAIYYFSRNQIKLANDRLLDALTHAIIIGSQDLTIKCLAYFEQYRRLATHEQKTEYKKIMKGVIDHAQMASNTANSDSTA